jgi:hypothetical protein
MEGTVSSRKWSKEMFSIIGDGIVVESCIAEKDVQFYMEDVKARGYSVVESRRMEAKQGEFRTMEEIQAERAWQAASEFPDNPTEGDLQTLEYFGDK